MKKLFYIIFWLFLISCIPSFAQEDGAFLESPADEILLEDISPFELMVNKTKFLDTYVSFPKEETSRLEYKKGNVSFFSDARKELNDYMTNDYKSGMHAKYVKERFSLTGGYEMTYRNTDASLGTKKFYVAPSLNLTDTFSLSFSNKINPDSKDYEQEVGFNYSPKYVKNAQFGVKAGTVWDEGDLKSQSLKFSTDLFLF